MSVKLSGEDCRIFCIVRIEEGFDGERESEKRERETRRESGGICQAVPEI
jgi:hypothetical protein